MKRNISSVIVLGGKNRDKEELVYEIIFGTR